MDIENTLVCDIPDINEPDKVLKSENNLSAKIQHLIDTNRFSISSILILIPSITVPAYHDWRHPLIGISLGLLSQITIVMVSTEQLGKKTITDTPTHQKLPE